MSREPMVTVPQSVVIQGVPVKAGDRVSLRVTTDEVKVLVRENAMLTSIEVTNLRGIAHGEIPCLSRLSVVTGPNDCGKSTLLDAMHLAGSGSNQEECRLGRGGSHSVLYNGEDEGAVLLKTKEKAYRYKLGAFRDDIAHIVEWPGRLCKTELFDSDAKDWRYQTDGTYGQSKRVFEGLAEHIRYAVEEGAVLLLDNPDLHQHQQGPVAEEIWKAVRHGPQVVLTTHSLDLIDHLLARATPDELQSALRFHRCRLKDGKLTVASPAGEVIAVSRKEFNEDVR